MKLVAISDLHGDQSTAGVDRFDDVRRVLTSAVDHAMHIKADAFFFLGDLADPHTVRAHRAVDMLAQAAHTLAMDRIPMVIIPGNHDVIEDGSGRTVLDSLRWQPYVKLFAAPDMHLLTGRTGKNLCELITLPFVPTSKNYDPDAFILSLAGEPLNAPPLVIGHLNLEGITPGSETTDMPRGRDVFWPLEALRSVFPEAMLLGGHYHTPQIFNGVNIIGSAVRLRFDEADNDPGFVTLEV